MPSNTFTLCSQAAGRDGGVFYWWRCEACGETGGNTRNDRRATEAATGEHRCPGMTKAAPLD
jgi:hypothetical protein